MTGPCSEKSSLCKSTAMCKCVQWLQLYIKYTSTSRARGGCAGARARQAGAARAAEPESDATHNSLHRTCATARHIARNQPVRAGLPAHLLSGGHDSYTKPDDASILLVAKSLPQTIADWNAAAWMHGYICSPGRPGFTSQAGMRPVYVGAKVSNISPGHF